MRRGFSRRDEVGYAGAEKNAPAHYACLKQAHAPREREEGLRAGLCSAAPIYAPPLRVDCSGAMANDIWLLAASFMSLFLVETNTPEF